MSPRASTVRFAETEFSLWLIFKRDGSLRMTRTRPGLDRGERAMSLTLTVPKALFEAPSLSASITIEDPGTPRPDIDISAAAAALSEVVGCDVDVRVNVPPAPEATIP